MKTRTKLLMFTPILAAAFNCLAQPNFTTQPANQTVNQGFNATFRAVAFTASPPLSYQWYSNSNAVPWATTNTLTIANARPTDAGGYFLVAADSAGSVTSRVATLTVNLPAPLDPKLSANIRLGEDPQVLPTNRRAEGEPHIARSPADPNLLIATYMEGIGLDIGTCLGCGYSVSTNGGLTWTRDFIPGVNTLKGGTYPLGADAVCAIDRGGNLWVTTLGLIASPPRSDALFISKSADRGQSFAPPRRLFLADTTYDPDKEWIAINTFPDSPTANRIAVAFTREGGSNQVHCTYSDDGGITWSQPKPLGSRDATAVQLAFLPDGSLAVLYVAYSCGYAGDANCTSLHFVLSPDGGVSFGSPVLVQNLKGIAYQETLAFNWSLPTLTANRQAGVLYLAYPVLLGPSTNRVPRIWFTKSIDRGATWTPPVTVNDTPNKRAVSYPAIAVSPDGQHVTISFQDRRNQTATSGDYLFDLYLAESFDGGDTWQSNLRLSEFSSDLRLAPTVYSWRWVCDYEGIVPALNFEAPGVAVWVDTRSGNLDPYVVRIARTKGTTFDTWRKLHFSTNDIANAAISSENADPDADGIPNLVEYAFGLEPTRFDAAPLKIALNVSGPTAIAIASYERLAVLSDIQFSWQSSADLAAWTPVSPAQELLTVGRDPSMQLVEASFPVGDQMKFFRLGVAKVAPPPSSRPSVTE